jgi:hypothetical protein
MHSIEKTSIEQRISAVEKARNMFSRADLASQIPYGRLAKV